MSDEISVVVDDVFDVANVGRPSVIAHTHPATDINDSSAIGRSILTAADAATERALLGIDTTANQTFTASGTGAVARTVESKLRDFINVKDYGAVGDGSTDDSSAIQAAINAAKPTSVAANGLPDNSSVIYFPKGTYLVNTSISVWSGIILFGNGAASTLKAGPSLTTQILTLAAFTGVQCRWVDIGFLNFEATGTVRAIKTTAGQFLNSCIHDCTFDVGFAIDCNIGTTYVQSCRFIKCTSVGSLDQFLSISGNRNYIEDFNKEGSTGSSTHPYIYIYDSNQVYLENILIEGSGSANKVGIKIAGGSAPSSVTIVQVWNETSTSNGYILDIDSSVVWIYGEINYITGTKKVKVANSSTLYVDWWDDNGTTTPISGTVEVDSTSYVCVDRYKGRSFTDIYKLDNLKSKFKIKRAESGTGTPTNGYLTANTVNWIGGNMLVNPSFEAGRYGWTVGGAPTITVEPSEVSTGLMMRLVYGASTTQNLTQSFTIDANQAGRPFTFCGMVKLVAGDTGSWASITATGCGMTAAGSDGFISKVSLGEGWQIVSQTFTPITAGTLVVGFRMFNHTEVLVDNASFHYGIEGEPDRSLFGSVELNQKTFTTATAAPTNGTWKVGDRVFNSVPSVGNPKSWVCTVAGTPGTWVSEGNL